MSKNKEKIQKFKEAGDSRYISQNKLDKAFFQHDLVYGLTRTTTLIKVLRDKAFNITKNPKHDEYQRGFASMVCKYFDKKSFGCGVTSEIMSKQKLGKLSIRKLKKQKVYLTFKDNIWGAGLADIQLKNVM